MPDIETILLAAMTLSFGVATLGIALGFAAIFIMRHALISTGEALLAGLLLWVLSVFYIGFAYADVFRALFSHL